MPTEVRNRLSLEVPWSTLVKVLVAVLVFAALRQLIWLFLLLVVSIIIAVGLAPVVRSLQRRGWRREFAATTVVAGLVITIVGFLALTWTSLVSEAQNFSAQFTSLQQFVEGHAPAPLLKVLKEGGGDSGVSALASYAASAGASLMTGVAAFAFAWILVLYLLIEGNLTYRWVRGFVPPRLHSRFDRTAAGACEAAYGYVVGNVVTSILAGVYTFVWLIALGVPAALLLATIAFLCDFVPVLGFFLACGPAMIMAATRSIGLALAMIPIYLTYHLVENYVIGPRVYGRRLRLSNLAVLVAFAIGAELGGVIGALVALPLAAMYPTIERLWMRGPHGDEIIDEHQRLQRGA
jgi:predicted PurR-regulated permease PerM